MGLANLALCASIGSIALRHHDQRIWFIYPVVVMILQGLAWMVAAMLRPSVIGTCALNSASRSSHCATVVLPTGPCRRRP